MDIHALRRELKSLDKRFDVEIVNDMEYPYRITCVDGRGLKYTVSRIPIGGVHKAYVQIVEEIYKLSPIHHGAKEVNRLIDEQIEKDEKAEEKSISDALEYTLAESYDIAKRREGLRINNIGIE